MASIIDHATDDVSPRVSVVLLTFNHEAYIDQALSSVLSQKTDFVVEVIVTEDCSTDRTWELVEAADKQFGKLIQLVRSPVNLNTNVVTTRALDIARGEYIAFLDGDDFWTSPDKLSQQVRFLDGNPHCSMCCHDVTIVDSVGHVIEDSFRRLHPGPDVGDYDDIFATNYIAGPSAMIRRKALAELPDWFEEAEFGDWALYILAAGHGSIGYIPEVLGAYRRHAGGYWTGMTQAEQIRKLHRFIHLMWVKAPLSRRPALDRALEHNARWAASLCEELRSESEQLRSQNEQLHSENERLCREWSTLDTQLATLKASNSWRFTAPLRTLGRVIRGSRSPG